MIALLSELKYISFWLHIWMDIQEKKGPLKAKIDSKNVSKKAKKAADDKE